MLSRRIGGHRRGYLYIPIWLYSNQHGSLYTRNKCTLYIPIWLYSNDYSYVYNIGVKAFTFQSGYIQIQTATRAEQSVSHFTFQSGYIQILQSYL